MGMRGTEACTALMARGISDYSALSLGTLPTSDHESTDRKCPCPSLRDSVVPSAPPYISGEKRKSFSDIVLKYKLKSSERSPLVANSLIARIK
ncbi:hypothetical protein J6590_030783 [Homalodisca vitripennis]|nr:hypothetical protein J6590_030783 [Homalodisca vitripennis]